MHYRKIKYKTKIRKYKTFCTVNVNIVNKNLETNIQKTQENVLKEDLKKSM